MTYLVDTLDMLLNQGTEKTCLHREANMHNITNAS